MLYEKGFFKDEDPSPGQMRKEKTFFPSPWSETTQIDFEAIFFARVLSRSPDNIDVLRRQGELLSIKGEHQQALEIDRRLVRLLPKDCIAFYNLACSLSKNELYSEALLVLRAAIERGYDDFEYLAFDQDLATLKKLPEFQQLIDEHHLGG